jgi:exonuclease SbcD
VAKIVHISDLHIGAKLGSFSQNGDIEKSLQHLVEKFCDADIFLISGDIFDNHSPSAESERIYYDFLYSLSEAKIETFIISGNHDSENRLLAPMRFLKERGIHIFTSENYSPHQLTIKGEKFSILPIPYLSEVKVAKEYLDISDEVERNRVYGEGFISIVENMVEMSEQDSCKILLSHSFVKDGSSSGSERLIQRGNIDLIDSSKLPDSVDYYAFGHLHRFQPVGKNGFYSGSIVPISIDEGSYSKRAVIVETENGEITNRTTYEIPRLSIYKELSGDFQTVLDEIKELQGGYISLYFNGIPTLSEGETVLQESSKRDLKIVFQRFQSEEVEIDETIDFQNLSIDELFLRFIRDMDLNYRDSVTELFGKISSLRS